MVRKDRKGHLQYLPTNGIPAHRLIKYVLLSRKSLFSEAGLDVFQLCCDIPKHDIQERATDLDTSIHNVAGQADRIIITSKKTNIVTLSSPMQLPFKFPQLSPQCPLQLFFLSPGSNRGLHVAFGCHSTLVSFNLDQSPIHFVLFCFSFMTLTFSKIAGQLFCSMSHNLDLPDYFLMIRFRLNISGKNSTLAMLCTSHCIKLFSYTELSFSSLCHCGYQESISQ